MNNAGSPRVLLIGPYDPHCGEYTFLAPPLGVWRLAGVLESAGVEHEGLRSELLSRSPATGARARAVERRLGHRRRLDNRHDAALRSGTCAHRASRGAARIDRRRRHGGDVPSGTDVRAGPFRPGGARRRRAAVAGARGATARAVNRSAASRERPNATSTARSSRCRSAR